jgi:hypothetical protein
MIQSLLLSLLGLRLLTASFSNFGDLYDFDEA